MNYTQNVFNIFFMNIIFIVECFSIFSNEYVCIIEYFKTF